MALDVAIIDSTGQIKRSTPVGWLTHDDLIRLADAIGNFPLILRLADYYQDAKYKPEEVEPLLAELRKLRAESKVKGVSSLSANLVNLLECLEELVGEALRDYASVHVIAD